jgi:membrane fusion protein (multidrug efflux system)
MSHINKSTLRHFTGLLTGCLVCCMLVIIAGCKKQQAPPAPVAAEVTAITVTPKTVPANYEFVAQTESSHQVEIVARVSGFLDKILYKEGEVVEEGEVMFLMDQKPFIAQVDAAKGELENRKAQLWTATANLERIKPLAEQDAVSKSDLDNATGAKQSAEASVYEAQASLDKAELDLSYTTIKSPVTGISSRSLLREGSYLSSAGTSSKLTYVAKLDPIWINFSVSQNEIAKMREEVRKGQLVTPKDDAYEVEIELSDGTLYPHKGNLSFADPSFSTETGTFLVRAVIANPKSVLRPGMFVKAYLKGAVHPNAIVVPQKAVQQTSKGHIVYVVNDKEQAELRPVLVGDWIGEDWIINQGLDAGDRVIVEGFQKLAPGAPVKVTAPQSSSTEKKEADTISKEKSSKEPAQPGKK